MVLAAPLALGLRSPGRSGDNANIVVAVALAGSRPILTKVSCMICVVKGVVESCVVDVDSALSRCE